MAVLFSPSFKTNHNTTCILVLPLFDMVIRWSFVFILLCFILGVRGGCHNDCNYHGNCTLWNTCECFASYEGPDCGFKICPKGPSLTDPDHNLATCSGQGDCNRETGLCECYDGYSGASCSVRSGCPNDCSGRGKCMSLRQMAEADDGYRLSYTTTYNQWDADLVKGCVCDNGE